MPATAPEAPISGLSESGKQQGVGKCAGCCTGQIEDQEAKVAHGVFDIVAENP
jgi:hypothetical protein